MGLMVAFVIVSVDTRFSVFYFVVNAYVLYCFIPSCFFFIMTDLMVMITSICNMCMICAVFASSQIFHTATQLF
jgi:hypothetical protein